MLRVPHRLIPFLHALTLLDIAVALACVAAMLGFWLSWGYLAAETMPARVRRASAVHGTIGIVTLALLFVALRRPGPPARFGWMAFVVLVAALSAGLTIFARQVRGREPSSLQVGIHGCLAMLGVVMLVAYFSTPASYAR